MKAKYYDFTSGVRQWGITKESDGVYFTRVYSIVDDPIPNIYQNQQKIMPDKITPKVAENGSQGSILASETAENQRPQRYNWFQ